MEVTKALIHFREMRYRLNLWYPLLIEKWGALPPVERFLPEGWARMVQVVGSVFGHARNEHLSKIEDRLWNAEALIRNEQAKAPSQRDAAAYRVAATDIEEARKSLASILQDLTNEPFRKGCNSESTAGEPGSLHSLSFHN